METFKKCLLLLTPNERKNAMLLVFMMLIMALLEMIGVASILPFMAVLTDPSIVETNLILNKIFQSSQVFGVKNNQQFLFLLGIFVFMILIISLTFKALTIYVQTRFVHMRQYTISKRLVEGYLHQPYSWFLNRHSADLGKTILSEVGQVVGGGMNPMMDAIAKSMVAITIVSLLFFTDPKLTIFVGFLLFVAYAITYKFLSKYLNKIGEENLKNNQLRYTAISEAFGAAKEVKVGGLENFFIKRFSNTSQIFFKNHAFSTVIAQLPRFAFEAIAFGAIILMILYLMTQTTNLNNVIPIISLYVFAGYRLMPAIQSIYSCLTKIAFVKPSVDKLFDDVKNLKIISQNQIEDTIPFYKSINLNNIHYHYPNTTREAVKNISLTIPAKSKVGLVGTTGCGKTTMVDIILGLLEATKGTLEVDGKFINKHNVRAWQRSIGYVPQHIYLSDDTIASNIAFGVNPKDINQDAVEIASKIANLHKFVMEELSLKYQTIIGERGIRLSGGQRQRIGIARALYNNPKVLILDEATSALDNQTEKAVMDAVNNLGTETTIILIAHRLSTVKNCDKIFLLEKGELKNQGTFEELININENFRITANN